MMTCQQQLQGLRKIERCCGSQFQLSFLFQTGWWATGHPLWTFKDDLWWTIGLWSTLYATSYMCFSQEVMVLHGFTHVLPNVYQPFFRDTAPFWDQTPRQSRGHFHRTHARAATDDARLPRLSTLQTCGVPWGRSCSPWARRCQGWPTPSSFRWGPGRVWGLVIPQ